MANAKVTITYPKDKSKCRMSRKKEIKDGMKKEVKCGKKPAYVYMLRCEGGSLYTGITTDPERRFAQHVSGGNAAARYTRSHSPLFMAAAFCLPDLKTAAKFEYAIKQLSKEKKEKLVESPDMITALLPHLAEYRPVPLKTELLPGHG